METAKHVPVQMSLTSTRTDVLQEVTAKPTTTMIFATFVNHAHLEPLTTSKLTNAIVLAQQQTAVVTKSTMLELKLVSNALLV